MATANEMLRQHRVEKEGSHGKEVRAKIAQKRAEADKLANTRNLTANEAVATMQKVSQLHSEADGLERYLSSNEFDTVVQARKRNESKAAVDAFSQMQAGFAEQQAGLDARVDIAMEGAVNFLVGTDKPTLRRQVETLLNGGGETDAQGNKYTRFQVNNSGAMNRAVMTPEGQFGFVVETRSNGA